MAQIACDKKPSLEERAGQLFRRVQDLKKKRFWTMLLDGKKRVLKLVRISEGTLTSSLVQPREVCRPAIEKAAPAMRLAHNHPSGDTSPSEEDRRITTRLVATRKGLRDPSA